MAGRPFDAVLVISFGGPQGPEQIRPFLENVLRGRRVPAGRIDEVAHHYEHFGGVSPLTEIARRQAAGLEARLAAAGVPLPVHVGMRNWHPLLVDTLREMSRAGFRRAIGFIAAPQRSYSSCTQYRQNVADARAQLASEGHPDVSVTYVDDWHTHQGFVDVHARHVRAALARLPAAARDRARLIFTAHSIPGGMAAADTYVRQLHESARLVAARSGMGDQALVYQSRSGRPEDPWLEPDVCDYLRAERAKGLDAAVLCPIGFVCDHVEVLWDLDQEAAGVAREVGIALGRASAANDDPGFLDMMADVVLRTWRRYEAGMPLSIVPAAAPGPPPAHEKSGAPGATSRS